MTSSTKYSVPACGTPATAEAKLADSRQEFPIFAGHPDLIFFDNASTSQKPASVLQTINEFYALQCTNAGRAAYRWSTKALKAIEETRLAVAQFLNAEGNEVIFTSGATESLNMVATCWGLTNLADGDEIMLCLEDHQSAIFPWLNLKRLLAEFGRQISIVPFPLDTMGDYPFAGIRSRVSTRTRLIAISHIHHVYGLDMEVNAVREIVGKDVVISLDASQSVGHTKVDVKALDVDFVSFSGHKMFAGNGTGILWIHNRRQGEMSPIRLGGYSSATIAKEQLSLNTANLPLLLENGTQNIPSILSLRSAIEFIDKVGLENIERGVSDLTFYLLEQLKTLPHLEFAPGLAVCNCPVGYGIISFRSENISTTDLAFLLDSENIFVRTGDHCLPSAGERPDYLRVSLHLYNTRDEIDRFINVLRAHIG